MNSFRYCSDVLSLALGINLIFEYAFVYQADIVLGSQWQLFSYLIICV